MVYNAKTFEILHELTEEGKIAYQKMLEEEADKIIFRHQHPVKAFIQEYVLDTKLMELFREIFSSR